MSGLLKKTILPLTVFPLLTALAMTYIFGHIEPSGLGEDLRKQCTPKSDPSLTPYLLNYTTLPDLDPQICNLVALFHNTMDESIAFQQLLYFMITGVIFVILPAMEASRSRRSILMAYPVIWLLLTQVFTIGVTMSVYWLVFVLTSLTLSSSKDGKKITHANAEAIIFGLLIGAAVPSAAMLILNDPQVTAIWQIYPIFFAAAEGLHLLFRRPSKLSYSGYPTIQVLLLACFMVSSSFHFSTVWPIKNDIAAMKALFIPSTQALDPSTALGLRTLDFLKWDLAFGVGSTIVATLWFANTVQQLFTIIAWYAVMVPLVGPCAAVMGVALWRESNLQ